MEDKSAPVIVARAWTDGEASVIKSLLESYEIPCHYSSELPNRLYSVSAEGLGQIRVFVPARLAEEAKRILDEHRRRDATLRLVED
jgi:hypothetical protein